LKTLPADAAGRYAVGAPFVAAGKEQKLEEACNVTAVTPLCLRVLYGTSYPFLTLLISLQLSIFSEIYWSWDIPPYADVISNAY
jgi:hypothetical protein